MSAIAALLAVSRSRFGVEAAARGRRSLSVSPAVRNGCQPAGPAVPGGGSGGSGGSGAGRQSMAALGSIAAGGAFLFNEIRATRSEVKSTCLELTEKMERVNERLDRMCGVLVHRSSAPGGEAAPSGGAAPSNASGGGAAA